MMMKIIDLTAEIKEGCSTSVKEISMPGRTYSGIIHGFRLSSMSGTYIDFPGHIGEFDDGADAAVYPLKQLFMLDAAVIRLDRKGRPREISAAELKDAAERIDTECLVIDSGWKGAWDDSGVFFFGKDAVEWIVSRPIRLLVSDVYENHSDPQGIFVELFRAGISCVCIPANLGRITAPRVKICAIPLKIPGAVQLPCRLFAVE